MFGTIIKAFGLVKDFGDSKEWLGKRWFLSKTLWVNLIAFLAISILPRYGITLTSEEQGGILVVMNMILRIFAKQPLVMKESSIVNIKECEDKANSGIELAESPK
jgi:hypothetical protein